MIRFALISIFLLMSSAHAYALDWAPLDSAIDARYAADAPGAAVIVARGDSILYERYIGRADMQSGAAIDTLTRFCIASISK